VDIKQISHDKVIREIGNLKKRNKQVTIFMSSSTDPYQPIEYKEKMTRTVLEAMTEMPPDFLFVQTRSPLVTRDIDLFAELKDKLRISVTVETDIDLIRKTFTPYAPPIQARLKAVRMLRDQGLPVQIAVAPVLPFSDEFPDILSKHIDRVVIDDFYTGDGSHGKRTAKLNIKDLYDDKDLNWYSEETHLYAVEKLKSSFKEAQIFLSQQGFMPF
jgi:DNA repair photolyase